MSPIVIDTNVAFDLWLFARPGLDALLAVMPQKPLIGTLAMRDELAHVLHHSAAGNGPIAAHRVPPGAAAAVMSSWDHHVRIVEAPMQHLGAWPRCRDASDQKFVDLALAERAGWLLTRDRALLKLSRRCRGYGLVIVVPDTFSFAAP